MKLTSHDDIHQVQLITSSIIMFFPSSILLLTASFASIVAGNAEKAIFLGPAAISIPTTKPTLSDLNLQALSPTASSIRTNLGRVFPNADVAGQEKGVSTWLLLDSLDEGQRYELRVCWSAVVSGLVPIVSVCQFQLSMLNVPYQEPTAFSMDVYELDHVWATPELMVSLANYAYAHMPEPNFQAEAEDGSEKKPTQQERTASVLLLHIQAAADYYSHDQSLMKDPPPVLVDLILDPYVYNVLPRSLIPTVGYIIAVAAVTWFVARWITASLHNVALEPAPTYSKKTK